MIAFFINKFKFLIKIAQKSVKKLIFCNIFSIFKQNIIMKKRKNKKLLSEKNDPLGAYTGTPIDGIMPTQDADDL